MFLHHRDGQYSGTNGNHNPFWDDLGHTWRVYYDIQRDSRDLAPCAMRVVMRIYNSAPDGSWSGTASVFADVNGSYNASSWGEVSGSSAYPNHFVWRGPWFGADFGSYVITIDLDNGSTPYTQANTTFSLKLAPCWGTRGVQP
jgi:hypothetical protein